MLNLFITNNIECICNRTQDTNQYVCWGTSCYHKIFAREPAVATICLLGEQLLPQYVCWGISCCAVDRSVSIDCSGCPKYRHGKHPVKEIILFSVLENDSEEAQSAVHCQETGLLLQYCCNENKMMITKCNKCMREFMTKFPSAPELI